MNKTRLFGLLGGMWSLLAVFIYGGVSNHLSDVATAADVLFVVGVALIVLSIKD